MTFKMALTTLAMGAGSLAAQNETIRLVYPQWQGGDIAHWITEIPDADEL